MGGVFISLIFLLIACNDNELQESQNTPEPNVEQLSKVVSYQEAVDEIYSLMDDIESSDGTTRSGGRRAIANSYIAGGGETDGMTRSSSESEGLEEPFVYIVNFENNGGFAIASGHKDMPPVLALTEYGSLNPGDSITNPGLALYLIGMEEHLAQLGFDDGFRNGNPSDYPQRPVTDILDENGNPIPIPERTTKYGPWQTTYSAGKIIPITMGQRHPWNAKIRNKYLAGCTAVACATVMYHHGYPTNNYKNYNFDWNKIWKIKNKWDMENNEIGAQMLTDLIEILGRSENLSANYGTEITLAYRENIPRTFKNMGYHNTSNVKDYSYAEVRRSIAVGKPTLVTGHTTKKKHRWLGIKYATSYKNGHVWVVDAVMERHQRLDHYLDGVYSHSGYSTTQQLVHCNWGWNGLDNGYFYTDYFKVDSPVIPDNGGGSSGANYRFEYLVGIFTGYSK